MRSLKLSQYFVISALLTSSCGKGQFQRIEQHVEILRWPGQFWVFFLLIVIFIMITIFLYIEYSSIIGLPSIISTERQSFQKKIENVDESISRLEKTIERLNEYEKENEKQRKEISDKDNKIVQLTCDIRLEKDNYTDLYNKYKSLEDEIIKLKHENNQFQKQNIAFQTTIIELNKIIESYATKKDFDSLFFYIQQTHSNANSQMEKNHADFVLQIERKYSDFKNDLNVEKTKLQEHVKTLQNELSKQEYHSRLYAHYLSKYKINIDSVFDGDIEPHKKIWKDIVTNDNLEGAINAILGHPKIPQEIEDKLRNQLRNLLELKKNLNEGVLTHNDNNVLTRRQSISKAVLETINEI